jgi:hypothetical protein
VLAGGACLGVITWRRPDLALLTLVALVPLNPVFFARATALGVPTGLAANLSYWKELLVLVLLAKLIKISRTGWLDYVAFGYLGLVALFLVLPLVRLVPSNLIAQLTAAREDAEFVAIFLIARHVPMPDSVAARLERAVIGVGALFGVLAVYSHFFPVEYWLFSVSHLGMGNTYFTTVFGAQTFVRAGMIFGSPVNLAFYLLIPVAIAITRAFSNRRRFWYAAGGAVSAAGVLCTVTRSAILAIPLMLALAMIVARRRVRVAVVFILGVLVLYPLFGSAGVGEGVRAGVDPANSETASHLSALWSGLIRVLANPLGSGLATSGHTAQRFEVLGAITPEDWYLQIGVELGVIGMLLFIALVVLTLRALWQRARARQPQATAALLALTGIAACGIVLHSFEDLGVAITVWALAGIALRPVRLPVEGLSSPGADLKIDAPSAGPARGGARGRDFVAVAAADQGPAPIFDET